MLCQDCDAGKAGGITLFEAQMLTRLFLHTDNAAHEELQVPTRISSREYLMAKGPHALLLVVLFHRRGCGFGELTAAI